MTIPKNLGLVQRIRIALRGALQRAFLGRSADEYMKQFTGDDEYWNEVIAAQRGWPGEGSEGKGSNHRAGQQVTSSGEALGARAATSRTQRMESGPVNGQIELQRHDHQTRNPGAMAAHELKSGLHPHDWQAIPEK